MSLVVGKGPTALMPPRPNDRGSRLCTPHSADDVVRQSSQSYDISSQGEEDDDFIGNDSDDSLEGSWDSSGKVVARQQQNAPGRAAPSSQGDSDDGFIAQDTSSGGEDYEGAFERGQPAQREHLSAPGGFRQEGGESGDSGFERDDDDRSEQGSAVAVAATNQSEDRYASGYDGAEVRRDLSDDEQEEQPVRALPHADNDSLKNAAAAQIYSFEEESDDGSRELEVGASDTVAAQRRREDAATGVVKESTHGSRSASIAQEYMQSRLSMHLLPVEGSDDDDDDATPRLPSLSARVRERQEEAEMLLKAREQNQKSEAEAPDEGGDDEPTPRLDSRSSSIGVHGEGETTPRLTTVNAAESIDEIARKSTDEADATLAEADAAEDFSDGQVWRNDGQGGNADLSSDGALDIQDALERAVAQVVERAITEAGGTMPCQLKSEGSRLGGSTAGAGEVDVDAQAEPYEGQTTTPEDPDETVESEGQPVLESLEAGGAHATRAGQVDSDEGRLVSIVVDQDTRAGNAPLGQREEEESQGAAAWQLGADGTERTSIGDTHEREMTQAEGDLQTSVTAEAYLSEGRLDTDALKPAPSSFAGYSTKINASDYDESSTRPSSRASSIGSASYMVGWQKAQQPRVYTRIQERNARNAQSEVFGENSQVRA